MRPVVITKKHYVQQSLGTVASGAITNIGIIDAFADPVMTTPNAVREGAVISAVYIEMWITSDDAAQGSAIVTIEKVPGLGASFMTAAESAALHSYDNKKNVFYTFMGLIGPNVQPAAPSVRGWFKIPKGKRRFGLEDKLMINIHGQSNGVNFCGFETYKEQL